MTKTEIIAVIEENKAEIKLAKKRINEVKKALATFEEASIGYGIDSSLVEQVYKAVLESANQRVAFLAECNKIRKRQLALMEELEKYEAI